MKVTTLKGKKPNEATVISTSQVEHLAKLANIPVTEEQKKQLTEQVGITVSYVSKLQELDTKGVAETSQVTGLENIFREDKIDLSRTFTQEVALSNAKRTHNGFFVVDAVLEEKS